MKYLAQEQIKDYQMLTPLPDVRTDKQGGINEFRGYVPNLFNLVIGLAVVIAVGWIIFGGIQYMTTDSWTGKEEGRNKIKNSIIGLLIIICSYLILNTINPRILTLDLSLEPTKTTTTQTPGGGGGGGPMSQEEIAESDAVRTSLRNEGVATNNGPCTLGQTRGCTNLNDLPNTAKDGLVLLSRSLGCTQANPCLTVTGGTEGGHATHGADKAIVDLSPGSNLNQYLGRPNPQEGNRVTKTFTSNGQTITATFTYEELGGNASGTSSGNHWHVTFN